MMGAIIGDIVGSRFEFNNHKSKDFEFFDDRCEFTDDTVMTLAVAKTLLKTGVHEDNMHMCREFVSTMRKFGRLYPYCSYGARFISWIYTDDPMQAGYNSYGNGSAMRVSPIAWATDDISTCEALCDRSAIVSHNHKEGRKGAMAIGAATFLARIGESKEVIKQHIERWYHYDLNFRLDDIRDTYSFDETCQGTVPQAIVAFLEADSFEDAIRNAISIGGDSDTIAACAGSIAEAYFGITRKMRLDARAYLDSYLLRVLNDFEAKYPPRICA